MRHVHEGGETVKVNCIASTIARLRNTGSERWTKSAIPVFNGSEGFARFKHGAIGDTRRMKD